MKTFGGWVALALVGLVAGCEPGASSDEGGCDWVTTEVDLDTSFGTITYGGLGEFELTPRAVVERFEQPVQGELRWRGDNDWFTMGPEAGTTTFWSRTVLSGPVWWIRVPGAKGDELLRCAESLVFHVTYEIRTEDGWFDEAWPIQTRYKFAGLGGMSAIDLNPAEVGVPETLGIEPTPNPPQPYGNARYGGVLTWGFLPANPVNAFTGTEGSMYYRGDFANPDTGEIMEGGGINALIVEWRGTNEWDEGPSLTNRP